jgi:5-methylcytosine-specific restriction enzyme A
MPLAAKRPCTQPGCKALSDSGRCDAHRIKADRERGTAQERGYTSAWTKARAAWLRKHPLCAEHARQGRVEAANAVDHITPHKGDKDLFWASATNWQSLCKTCHDRKTATEDGGFGR